MALIGTHVACGFAGARGGLGNGLQILGKPVWSETMAAAGTTAKGAPTNSAGFGDPVFSIHNAAAAIFYAIGGTPDASASSPARRYLPADTPIDVYGEAGDKLAWILA